MSDSFIGQIDWFAFGYVPGGYLACDGTVYNISQYPPLASLLGTVYGGDGRNTFGVPNL